MAYKISNDCIECGSCVSECPVNAITDGSPYKIDAATCTDCGACASVCPVDAISAQ
ncbi:MAG: 4Fe-4S ferredoxin [Spirochaetes bacterium GWF1_31_7]|nr:MAG: 4Fe-4S ferredoxin [Spirochaetes bacterium GWE1_32_154]OHD48188.1 MAG: 4Fe-4S ferredoxin [Spirochaetes bacterium GWE2_31_10]OHD50597.1 MAG: 4Fe-4S ferredoxin [Spirochaetes bacterium GWF1_31_7]OHD80443.1 MAG: 4Fe-4S ferredoxin [Spirochaetes bacterium RIFOXYB1_FULL_32_8]HBD94548.1 4Fe-4S ferredoxin [Spirochaetia bacterium]